MGQAIKNTTGDDRFKWRYSAEKEVCHSPDTGQYLTYKILIKCQVENGWELTDVVHDVSLNNEEAARIASMFNTHQLSPVHFREAIEDIIGC